MKNDAFVLRNDKAHEFLERGRRFTRLHKLWDLYFEHKKNLTKTNKDVFESGRCDITIKISDDIERETIESILTELMVEYTVTKKEITDEMIEKDIRDSLDKAFVNLYTMQFNKCLLPIPELNPQYTIHITPKQGVGEVDIAKFRDDQFSSAIEHFRDAANRRKELIINAHKRRDMKEKEIPWYWWLDECKLCTKRAKCAYRKNTEDCRKKLESVGKDVSGVYGTLKFKCDYIDFDWDAWKSGDTDKCYNDDVDCPIDACHKLSFKETPLELTIKYFDGAKPLEINPKGNWIDVYANCDIGIAGPGPLMIPLGFAMKLPEGYEAILAPRSSTFKTWKIIQTNHIGVIDESYCGDNDQWYFPAYALETTVIKKGDKIGQFRIVKHQPPVSFNTVEHLDAQDRGGFGTTGTK